MKPEKAPPPMPGEERQDHELPVGRARRLHAHAPAEGRGEEQQRGQGDHLAGAHDRRQHHPHEADEAGGEARHGGHPVELVLGEVVPEVALSLGMIALGRNHATKHRVRQNVVIHSVRHARRLVPGLLVLGVPGLQPLALRAGRARRCSCACLLRLTGGCGQRWPSAAAAGVSRWLRQLGRLVVQHAARRSSASTPSRPR